MEIVIHPMMVHFPIAFYFLELILLALWRWKQKLEFRPFALFVFRLAYVSMLIAIAAGLFDAGGLSHLRGKVLFHFTGAVTVFLFYTARAFYWRFGKESSPAYAKVQVFGAIFGNLIVWITAYWGGRLVFA